MSQLTNTSVAIADVEHDAQKNTVKDPSSVTPVVITEQEVMLGTRAALSSPVASAPHRWLTAIRVAAGSLRLPPPRRRYWVDGGYLEQSRMAREMDRL